MSDRITALYDERHELDLASRKILDAAEKEKRDLTSEETQEWDRMDERIGVVGEDIDRRERQFKRETMLSESRGRQTTPDQPLDQDPEKDLRFALGKDRRLNCERELVVAAGSELGVRGGKGYRQAFADYCHGRAISADLQTAVDPKGGYLSPTTFITQLIRSLDDQVTMRQLGNVLPPLGASVSLGAPSLDADPADATWTAEVPASDLSDDTTMTFGKRELAPHLLTKLIKVSMKLLRSSIMSVESIISDRMAYKFAITEEKAFLTGDGADQPLGVMTADSGGISTNRDITAAANSKFTADELMDTLYSLKEGYQSRSTWLLHRTILKAIRKLKDGQSQYLWQPGLSGGNPGTILDRPYRLNENMGSTQNTTNYQMIVGDFSFYWIVDSLSMEVQRLAELFALKNQVGFVGRKETDGMPVLEEAFARLILA